MSHRATDDALAYYARIRDLILQHGGGWHDRNALEKFRLLCRAAARASGDAECAELLRSAEQYAAELFSESAHYRWTRAKTSGADVLRLCILGRLDALRDRLQRLRQEMLALRGISAVDGDRGAGDEV